MSLIQNRELMLATVLEVSHNSLIAAIHIPLFMFKYQINIVPKWVIECHPLYFFSEEKKLYNINTGKEVKPVLKGYTIGYNLNGKFYSRKQLKPLIKKYSEPEKLPF